MPEVNVNMNEKNADDLIKEIETNQIDRIRLEHRLDVQKLTEALAKNTSLKELDLKNNHIGDEGAKVLLDVLKNHSALQALFLWFNPIGGEGAIALAQVLNQSSTLQKLHLWVNNIGAEGAIALAQALEENNTLQHLHLLSNQIGDKGTIALAQALKKYRTLRTLQLPHNDIGEEGAIALAQALTRDSMLQELDLGQNNIRKEGAIALAQTLTINSSLRKLDLYDNNITEKGGIALAQALTKNSTLKVLNLNNNYIGKKGTIALAKALKENRTLHYLSLDGNNIGNEGVIALAQALKENSTLQTLNLRDKTISGRGVIALVESLEQNHTIQAINIDYELSSSGKLEIMLNRNQEIFRSISSLQETLSSGIYTAASLEQTTAELRTLIPVIGTNQAPFAENHPIAEVYRLVNGLLYAMQGDSASLRYAFKLFDKPFHQARLQKAADTAIAEALFVSGCFENMDAEIKAARYQFILHYYRHQLENPHFSTQIKTCLKQLKNPEQQADPNTDRLSIKDLTGAEQLLSYDQMLAIAREALQLSEDDHEIITLKRLLQQHTYDPKTSDYFWRCPHFRAQFQQCYPKVETFRILENYLINPMEVPCQLFSIHDPMNAVDEQQLTQLKPFNFTDYLKYRLQSMMLSLVLLKPTELLAIITSTLTTSLRLIPLEQQIKKMKISVMQFFQTQDYTTQDHIAFFQRLFDHFKDNQQMCLLIAAGLVTSQNDRLLPLQTKIAQTAFPEEDEIESRQLLQRNMATLRGGLSQNQIDVMLSLSKPLQSLDEKMVIQILDSIKSENSSKSKSSHSKPYFQ
jgi:Ran GTPase-activating protein (RanGAP) involved in mRNA processing and transport